MKPRSRRDSILSVARRAFTAYGYDGTAVGDLAKELGVSKAAITYHFPAKADFLPALLDPLVDSLQAVIDDPHPVDWPDGARRLVTRYLEALVESDDLARWADTDPALKQEDRPGIRLRDLDQRFADKLTNSTDTATRLRGLAVVGGLWRPLHHEPAASIREHLDDIVDAALASYEPMN